MDAQVKEDFASSALRILADPTRLRLLRELPQEDTAEVAVGELAQRLGVSDTVVSQHLRVLSGAGLVDHRRHGRATYYSVRLAALVALRQALASELPRMFEVEA